MNARTFQTCLVFMDDDGFHVEHAFSIFLSFAISIYMKDFHLFSCYAITNAGSSISQEDEQIHEC